MRHIFILLAFITLSCSVTGEKDSTTFTNVHDIYPDSTYTHSSIVETLGIPSSCDTLYTDSYGDVIDYKYGNDSFTFSIEDGHLVGCNITSSSFKLNNTIGVGDNISTLESISATKGDGNYYIIDGNDTYAIYIYYTSDTISTIKFNATI